MADYLARRGPAGARMMRQTASFQVNLDFDDEPWLRWRVLNAAAPYVVAMFANSSVYAGADTGCVSARAQVWRALDPDAHRPSLERRRRSTTYLDFALGAPALLLPTRRRRAPALRRVARRGPSCTPEEWHDHLTTLFPEVRPRGHLELRSADAVRAPVVRRAARAGGRHRLRSRRVSAPPPTCWARPTSDSSPRAGPHRPARPRDGPHRRRPGRRSRSTAAPASGPAYFHPADLEEARGVSSSATPAAARCAG